MLIGKLLDRNGKLFVLYTSPNENKPVITYFWYAVERTQANAYTAERPKEGDIVEYYSGNRSWSARDATTQRSTGAVFTAEHGTKESVSAPTPKVRSNIETRWYCGRWEKLMKKGWVSA